MTTTPRSHFIQIHTLHQLTGVLANRDQSGFAKRLNVGGAVRTRISSQCRKRHWRTHEAGPHALGHLELPETLRSREIFTTRVIEWLTTPGERFDVAHEVVAKLMDLVFGSKKERAASDLVTGQLIVLGAPEVAFLRDQAAGIIAGLKASAPDLFEGDERADGFEADDRKRVKAAVEGAFGTTERENLRALGLGAGLSAALFGRMITGDVLARVDGAVHVNHAFTVHAQHAENDYFTAVDELTADSERGAATIGNTELNSGLYYGYVVVDVPTLVSNLTGTPQADWRQADHTLAARVVSNLIHLIATVSPAAKTGSTAGHGWAQMVYVEAGGALPRSLGDAFLRPVRPSGDMLAQTYRALGRHYASMRSMYGPQVPSRLAAMGDPGEVDGLADALGTTTTTLTELADWAGGSIGAGDGGAE